jgi:predicted 3-demethylubiquinone-9 3-methyltransferase (glyoxalase superfamily)
MANIKEHQNKITPCLWFNTNAQEAVNFYISVFKNSSIDFVTYYGKNSPLPEGTVLTIRFNLDGHTFIALNAGPEFAFSEAISFIVNCDTQEEIDEFWEKLSEGGQIQQCGWLKDKFGLSWQIVPTQLSEMLQSKDTEKSNRVIQAIMQMIKLDINEIKNAFEN